MSLLPVTWLESQFYTNDLCIGSPDIIKVFATADPTDYDQGEETWPEIYSFQQTIDAPYPYSVCGNLKVDLPPLENCCTSVLDQTKQEVGLVLSGNDELILGLMVPWNDDASIEDFVPIEAKSISYCQLSPMPKNDTVMGYQSLYYRQDGQCKDEKYKCSLDGKFLVYAKSNCTGAVESFDAPSAPASVTSKNMESTFSLSLTQFKNPKAKVGWTQFIPNEILVPNFKWAFEVIALMLFISSIIFNLLGAGWACHQYYQRKKVATALLGISQISFLLFICCRMVYVYTAFQDEVVMNRYLDATKWLNNLGSLFTCLYSAEFLLNALEFKNSIWKSCSLYAFVVIMHLLFAGVKYLYVFIPLTYKINKDPVLSFLTKTGNKNFYIWTLFYFLFDLIPPTYVIWFLFRSYTSRDIITQIWALDKYFLICLATQVLCATINYIFEYLRFSTYILRNDRNYLAATAVLAYVQSFHSILNGVIVVRMKKVMQNKFRTKNVSMQTNTSATAPQISTVKKRPVSSATGQKSAGESLN